MTKKYKIQGLECPNCARALEEQLNTGKYIKSAKIEFVKSTLEIKSDDDQKAVEEAIKIAKQVEPDAEIVVDNNKSNKSKNGVLIDVCLLLLGLVLAIITLTVKMPTWLYWTMFVSSALLMGYKTYYRALKLLLKGTINENFLVTLSVIGATLVGEHCDGLMVVGLYTIGKILESAALNKSKKSIEELTNIKPEFAYLVNENNEEIKVDPSEIKIGDTIIVKAGEKVAVDGVVISGNVTLNTQSLTGESLPVSVSEGDEVLSGSIVLDGVLYIKATKEYKNSTVSKILNLIENASDKKARTETVISKIARWYTLGIILLAIGVWGIVWAVTQNLNTAIYRGLIFLVISCPCAFAISVPLSYFSGIGNASRKGILVKGSNYLDVLTKIKAVDFDKTGTLTTGEFEIVNVIQKGEYKKEEIVYFACLGEQYSNHPLAKGITRNCTQKLPILEKFKEIAGEGVYFEYNNNKYFVGRKQKDLQKTMVEVYENDILIGIIELCDEIKESTKPCIKDLRAMGIKTIMLSGDNESVVKDVAKEVGLDEAYGKLLPEDKYKFIENQKKQKVVMAYVGDGINDAPSLTLADVGISMGLNGSEASIEASDIVIANDNPQKIVEAIKISKFTRKIVWQNIILSAVIKLTFLTLGALGITGMLSAVIADVGVTLLAILNSLRVLRYNGK